MPTGSLVVAHDIQKEGVVLQNDDVKVSACEVRHPMVKQAYAYRFVQQESVLPAPLVLQNGTGIVCR